MVTTCLSLNNSLFPDPPWLSPSVRNLALLSIHHCQPVFTSIFLERREINRIRHHLSVASTKQLMSAFVLTKHPLASSLSTIVCVFLHALAFCRFVIDIFVICLRSYVEFAVQCTQMYLANCALLNLFLQYITSMLVSDPYYRKSECKKM